MSDYAPGVETMAKIIDVIEQSGGDVEDFDVDLRKSGGLASNMTEMMGGVPYREPVYTFQVTVPGEWEEPEDADLEIEGNVSPEQSEGSL